MKSINWGCLGALLFGVFLWALIFVALYGIWIITSIY